MSDKALNYYTKLEQLFEARGLTKGVEYIRKIKDNLKSIRSSAAVNLDTARLLEAVAEMLDGKVSGSSFTMKVMKGPDFYALVGNQGLRARLKYLSSGWRDTESEVDLVVFDGDRVVGAAGLQQSPSESDVLWMMFISVDPDYKSRGIGRLLAEGTVDYAKKAGKLLSVSTFSDEGKKYLKPVYDRLRNSGDYRIRYSDDNRVDGSWGAGVGLALGLGLGLAAPSTPPKTPTTEVSKQRSLDFSKELAAISVLETGGDHGIAHEEHSGGGWTTAFGAVGLKPVTGYEQYKRSAPLQKKYPGLSQDDFEAMFFDNPQFYTDVAEDHWNWLKDKLKTPERTAYAWRFGRGKALKAKDKDIAKSGYVAAFKRLMKQQSPVSSSSSDLATLLYRRTPSGYRGVGSFWSPQPDVADRYGSGQLLTEEARGPVLNAEKESDLISVLDELGVSDAEELVVSNEWFDDPSVMSLLSEHYAWVSRPVDPSVSSKEVEWIKLRA